MTVESCLQKDKEPLLISFCFYDTNNSFQTASSNIHIIESLIRWWVFQFEIRILYSDPCALLFAKKIKYMHDKPALSMKIEYGKDFIDWKVI